MYVPDATGAASGTLHVSTGTTQDMLSGRTIIVHAKDGTRIACALLAATTEVSLTATGFVAYYDYAGTLSVAGTVGSLASSGTTQTFAYSLTGVDAACQLGPEPSTGNSCGGQCTA